MESYESLVASGLTPIKPTPIINGRVPPPSAPTMGRALVGTIPSEFQLDADFAENQYGGQIPSYRLMPPAASGQAPNNSTVVSGTNKIAETANQANSTATTIGNTPVMQNVGGTIVQQPILNNTPVLPGTPTQDNLNDGVSFVRLAATHAAANVAYNFQGAWSSATAYVIADEVTFNNVYWIALANNTNSQPATSNANWQAVGRIQGDLQIFTLSGIWSKPTAGSFAMVTVVGAGGGGQGGGGVTGTGGPTAAFGGGSGGISSQIFDLTTLAATESVVVGLSGAGGSGGVNTSGTNGTNGGTSSFGVFLMAGGGQGGTTSATSGGVGFPATGVGQGANSTTTVGGGGGEGGSAVGGSGTFSPGIAGGIGAGIRATPLAGGAGGATSGAAGSNGTSGAANEIIGGGGAGGGAGMVTLSAHTNITAGAGGNGGTYGAGGGAGGGAVVNASPAGTPTGGAGGNGSSGIVIVSVY